MSNPKATWCISLDTECPECGEAIDLFEQDWVNAALSDRTFDVCERDTRWTTDVNVTCPKCSVDFKVDFEY
ncbi:hypothetical protein [Celeribacter sp.]|uniref:hypothetical protein n=1 Tax=Celeribacter sp. TaxID=1890673 RepID=UPI003A8FD95F